MVLKVVDSSVQALRSTALLAPKAPYDGWRHRLIPPRQGAPFHLELFWSYGCDQVGESTYAFLTKYFQGSKAAVVRSSVQIGTMLSDNRAIRTDGNIAYELRKHWPIGSYGMEYHVRGRLESFAKGFERVLFVAAQRNYS